MKAGTKKEQFLSQVVKPWNALPESVVSSGHTKSRQEPSLRSRQEPSGAVRTLAGAARTASGTARNRENSIKKRMMNG